MASYHYDRNTIGDIAVLGAERFGDRLALAMAEGDGIGYRELERLSRRAAALLARLGVRKGDRVAILSENRPEWGLASLAIARAGAVAVPILADFPAEQVANILAHSGARAAFVSEKLRRKLPEPGPQPLAIEALSEPRADRELEWAADSFKGPEVEPGDLAAIVYTSGTTGQSKGVMLTHRNYIADALACSVIIVLDPSDVLLSILPLAHAYEYTIGFLIPMMSGASVRYLDRPPSASVLLPALAKIRPSIVLSVPLVIEKVYRTGVKPNLEKIGLYRLAAARPLLERIAGRKLMKSFGGRLRFFGIGGAPLDPETERFLRAARFPYAIGYGLTETAPIIAASAVGRTWPKAAGPALPGAEIRVADPRPADDDPGLSVGELQVRGPMVGPGYYKDEARTAEAFTPDGFFRTGDLGFLDEAGRFHVRGRLKTMILGPAGENIYPEEVEALLNSSPYVLESLVYGDERGLTALVQLKPEAIAAFASELGARVNAAVKDGIGEAAGAATRLGQAAGGAIQNAEHAAAALLERIKKETNQRLAAFSRLSAVEV
ncbi:MAG TPA: AMP-binding protein, partial [Spirochaetia bacterium]|nr:AMP-binding protein [Spirochaetia bacterium]